MNRKWAETHPARGEAPPSITHDFSYVRTPDSDGDSGCSNSLRTTDNVKFIAVVTALPFPSLPFTALLRSLTPSLDPPKFNLMLMCAFRGTVKFRIMKG